MNHMDNIINIAYSLSFVVLLILGMAIFAKKIKNKGGFLSKNISLIGSMALGNKEKILLIEVDNKKILIGVTANNIQALTVLNDKVKACE